MLLYRFGVSKACPSNARSAWERVAQPCRSRSGGGRRARRAGWQDAWHPECVLIEKWALLYPARRDRVAWVECERWTADSVSSEDGDREGGDRTRGHGLVRRPSEQP